MSGTNAMHYKTLHSKLHLENRRKTFPLLKSATFLQKIQNTSSIYTPMNANRLLSLGQMALSIFNFLISFFQLDYTTIVKRFQIIMCSKFNFFNFLLLLQKIPTFSAAVLQMDR